MSTPISTEQATRAVLRMLRTPIIGNVDIDSSPGHTIQRIKRGGPNRTPLYSMLSSGEQKLVDIAEALWTGGDRGARVNVLGGLDRDMRRRIIVILAYLYLGRDLSLLEADEGEFSAMFGGVTA